MDFSVWSFADFLTVEQAACLWAGVDPTDKFIRPESEKRMIAPYKQLLSGAIAAGVLPADSSRNAFDLIGDFSKSLIARESLREFAQQKGLRPAFLFDALIPGASRDSAAALDGPRSVTLDDVTALLMERLTASMTANGDRSSIGVEQALVPPKSKGGRPAEYDWDAFTVEIIRVADLDGLPEKQADLVSRMLEWCEQTWGVQPAESSAKERISFIYNKLGRGRKPRHA